MAEGGGAMEEEDVEGEGWGLWGLDCRLAPLLVLTLIAPHPLRKVHAEITTAVKNELAFLCPESIYILYMRAFHHSADNIGTPSLVP